MDRLLLHPASVPVLMIAGAMVFEGISHLLLARRRVQVLLNLMFALSCISMGCYDLFSAGLYSAGSAAEGAIWQRGQFTALAFMSAFLFWFVADYTGMVPRRVVYLFCGLFAAAGLIGAAAPRLLVDASLPMVRVIKIPLLGSATYLEATPMALAQAQGVLGICALAIGLWASFRFSRSGKCRDGHRMLQALSIFFVGVLSDAAVANNLYPAPYLMEYAYVAIALAMAAHLSRDVASSEEARSQLAATEMRFQSVFRSAAVGIGLTTPAGIVLQGNTALATMLGLNPADLAGTDLIACLHADDRAAVRLSLQDLLNGDIATYRDERRCLQPGGREVWCDLTASLVRRGNGPVDAMTWVLSSIEERRQAVESLRSVNEQLEARIGDRTAELTEANRKLCASLQKIEEDEGAAEMIQFSLLPQESRIINGIEFSRYLHPSTQMSGDFLDYFVIDPERSGFYIADVSGHGVSSAFVTVLLNGFIRRALDRYQEKTDAIILNPSGLMDRINRELNLQDLGKHVTFFYGVIDGAAGTLSFANAGHFPFPVLHGANRHEFLRSKGSPLGLFDGAAYTTATLPLPPAFMLAAFTDGVLEVLPQQHLRDKQEYLSAMVNRVDLTIGELVEKVGLDRAGATPDDATILLVKGALHSV